jgi:hypothetical protein
MGRFWPIASNWKVRSPELSSLGWRAIHQLDGRRAYARLARVAPSTPWQTLPEAVDRVGPFAST